MWKQALFLGAAAGLCACQPSAQQTAAASQSAASEALALTAMPEPLAEAPPAMSLPAAKVRYVPVSRPAQAYRYIDDAYDMADAFDDAPPDYAFDYDGARPWVWRSGDGAYRIYEASQDGGRYYYYHPGEAEPYLVRDPNYAYAYQGDELVTVFDALGRVLSGDAANQHADWAGRYLSRARSLQTAAFQARRQPVSAPVWASQRQVIVRQREQWQADQQRVSDWQAWHAQHDADARWRWAAEIKRRQQAAHDFDAWQARGFHGQGPQVASVAQTYRADERRNMDAQRLAEQQRQTQMAQFQHQQQMAELKRQQQAAQVQHQQQVAQLRQQQKMAQAQHQQQVAQLRRQQKAAEAQHQQQVAQLRQQQKMAQMQHQHQIAQAQRQQQLAQARQQKAQQLAMRAHAQHPPAKVSPPRGQAHPPASPQAAAHHPGGPPPGHGKGHQGDHGQHR